MKHFYRQITLLTLAAALAGCSDEDAPGTPPLPPASERPIYWDVRGVEHPGTRSLVGPDTKPGEDTPDWITLQQACTPTANSGEGKAIGIWADYSYTQPDGYVSTVHDIFKGTRLIYNQASGDNPHSFWNYEGDDLYWFVGGDYKFRAYFPQKLASYVLSSANASTFAMSYPSHWVQEDLLVAYKKVNTANSATDLSQPVDLSFSHALAAVRFRIQADYVESGRLTSCWLQSAADKAFFTDGTLAYGDENNSEQLTWLPGYFPPVTEHFYYWQNSGVSFSTTGTDAEQSRTPATAYTAAGTTDGKLFADNGGWVLICPQPSTGKLQFCFTLAATGDAVYRVTLPDITAKAQDGTESREFLPGKRYTYTITITKTELDLSLSISDWNLRESSSQITF